MGIEKEKVMVMGKATETVMEMAMVTVRTNKL
jgi:hypothetical protein